VNRRALFLGPGQLIIEDAEVPVPAPDEVILEVDSYGVCGTDRAIFRGDVPLEPPIVLGHEYSGTIVAAGPEVESPTVGERVCVDPNITCGRCEYCRRGLSHLCANLSPLGIARNGGFAEYCAVPAAYVYPLPVSLALEGAALVEPLACALRGLEQASIEPGDAVVILGAGAVGCLLLQLTSISGAAVVVVAEPDADRRARAVDFGAEIACDSSAETRSIVTERTDGLGADVVIEASGTVDGARLALDLVRRGGRVVWFGVYPQSQMIEINPYTVNENEITIRGSFNNPFTHQAAVTLAASGRIRLNELVSDRVALDQLPSVLDPAAPLPAGKVLVQPTRSRS
jgi:2-desacetyl-2-hydroxyethyl bacteriochlorophyllide A dehydrogenase